MTSTDAGRPAERDLRALIARVVREVPGVAEEPGGQAIGIQIGAGGVTIDCAVTAYHGVALHELGLTIQLVLVEALRRRGEHTHAVNVTIQDIHDPVR
jgi:hypothetical protein